MLCHRDRCHHLIGLTLEITKTITDTQPNSTNSYNSYYINKDKQILSYSNNYNY